MGAIRRFFGTAVESSFSDSLVSRLPRTLTLTELVALITPPGIGVCGGVVQGKPVKEVLDATTLGTLLTIGTGLLVTTPVEDWIWDDWVMIDEVEFDLVGLGG